MKVNIVILNYNGRDLLEKYLPSVILAARNSKYECAVSVIDNKSTDDSVAFIKEKYDSVNIYQAKENKVLCSYNDYLDTIDDDIAIFLNTDMRVDPYFVDPLIRHFEDEDVFFAAARLLNFNGTYNGGRSYLKFDFGILKNAVDADNAASSGETHSISTGAFKRKDFLEFGGFDKLYLPGIWEEVDICYKALLLGKKGIYEPNSIIWHNESTTFNREYGRRKKLIIAHRNMFLFFWKNIYDKTLLVKHLFLLPFRILYSILSGKIELAQGFVLALPRLPKVLARRLCNKEQVRLRTLKDRDIIK